MKNFFLKKINNYFVKNIKNNLIIFYLDFDLITAHVFRWTLIFNCVKLD